MVKRIGIGMEFLDLKKMFIVPIVFTKFFEHTSKKFSESS